MKIEHAPFRPFIASLICVALLGLSQFAPAKATDSGYSITRYGYIEQTIINRINMGHMTDRNCRKPTVDGHIALNEKLVGIDVTDPSKLGSTVNKIAYLIGDGQVFEVCIFDVAALNDVDGDPRNGERPEGQIADVSDEIWRQIESYEGFEVSFQDPRGNNINQTQIATTIIENTEDSIYENPQARDFHVDVSLDDTKIDQVSSEEPPITIITSGTVYDSRMESSSPIMTIECEPGPPDEQGNFEQICGPKFKDGYFSINPELYFPSR